MSLGQYCVGITFDGSDVFLNESGEPQPGLALVPSKAQIVAYRILTAAAEIEDVLPRHAIDVPKTPE